MCRGRLGETPGFVFLGPCKKNPDFHGYRADDDPLLFKNGGAGGQPAHQKGRKKENPEQEKDLPAVLESQKFARDLTHELREQLARDLQLPLHALDAISEIGYKKRDDDGPCYTFPMRNEHGKIIGVMRRWSTGRKKANYRSLNGLFIPEDAGEVGGPLFIVTGPSDVLAVRVIGLDCVGLASDGVGMGYLIPWLKEFPQEREMIVSGEIDANSKGEWPGLEMAKSVAAQLSTALGKEIPWALPPGRAKDPRAWCVAQKMLALPADDLHRIGEEYLESIILQGAGQAKLPEGEGLVTTCAADLHARVTAWLIPDYFPLSRLHLLGADSGSGKTLVCISIAAALSRGRPWAVLDYPHHEPVESLIFSREDNREEDWLPRLQACDADRRFIHLVDGVKGPKGELVPFSLADLEKLKYHLLQHPGVKYVLIDPVDSYITATGVDDFRTASLRDKITDPLQHLAETTGTVIKMILHLNKGESKKAVNRLANSGAYNSSSRASYMCMPEPGSKTNRVFGCIKINGARRSLSALPRGQGRPDAHRQGVRRGDGRSDTGRNPALPEAVGLCRIHGHDRFDARRLRRRRHRRAAGTVPRRRASGQMVAPIPLGRGATHEKLRARRQPLPVRRLE